MIVQNYKLSDLLSGNIRDPEEEKLRFRSQSIEEMTEELKRTHHKKDRELMDKAEEKLNRILGAGDPQGILQQTGLNGTLRHMFHDLREHFDREEAEVFPEMIRTAAMISDRTAEKADTQRVLASVMTLESEHGTAEQTISEIQKTTNYFQLPEDAILPYRELYFTLQDLFSDLSEHVEKENGILFPKFESIAE